MGLQTLSSRVNDPQNTFVLNVGMMNGGTQSNIITGEVELVDTTRAFDVDEDTFPDGSAIYARFAIDCLKKTRETLIKSLFDFTLIFSCNARNTSTRIASYLRRSMTKHCMKIHVKSNSVI